MEGSDESMAWLAFAFCYAELPGHQIARLKNPWWNPTWQEIVFADLTTDVALNFRWGTREKRSRFASTDAAMGLSPKSPYDFGFGSGASSNGGNDGSDSMGKRLMVDHVSDGCEDTDVRAPTSKYKTIRMKRTLQELQKEEKCMLAENSQLNKETETRVNH